MVVEDECATYRGKFDYSYDHLGNDRTAPPDDSNNNFQESLHKINHVHDK